ncbi:hypothetical protein ABID59_007576 [Bradyrhizobium sp. S3.3.6]|uniref:hypothetical protein n=1 Tax=Bradyrhizobium sp. S3.3.6 TaxID=3156429 RepID=UPI003398226D
MFALACGETMSFRKSIYEPLHQRLLSERGQIVRLTFSEMEEILRRKLPASAHIHGMVEQRKLYEGRAHPSKAVDERGISCACFDQEPRRRIPPSLNDPYSLALVEGFRRLEQYGLKSGDDQLV